MRKSVIMAGIAAVAFCAVTPALADATSTSQPASDPQADRVICKEVDVTGSLLPGPRICHTKAEWDQISHESQQNLRDVQDNGTNMTSGH